MCGIAGIVAFDDGSGMQAQLDAMLLAQAHRGPDGEGRELSVVGGARVALGHGRLAIIDLSSAGLQPMTIDDGNDVIIFNGEIYNYRELRDDLARAGETCTTASDTEVLLRVLRRDGVDGLARCNGMWAFAWLRRREQQLVLCRDRFGVKPLYLFRDGKRLWFSSEIKAVARGAEKRFAVNPRVVARYLMKGALDAQPDTFFVGVSSVPAGTATIIDLARTAVVTTSRTYWSLDASAVARGNITEQTEEIGALFRDAVRLRLRSDVPVGVLLSGGLDSSSIAAVMKAEAPGADLHLISAVSDDPRFDESPFIDQVQRHLDRPVHRVRLDFRPDDAFDLLGRVTAVNDEPVTSFSTVAHWLLMQRAREIGVTVLLSGQGGDEIFCGYRKYLGFYLQSLLRGARPVLAARTLAAFVANGTVVTQLAFTDAKRYLPSIARSLDIDIRGPRLRATNADLMVGLGAGSVADRQRIDLYQLSVPALVHYEDRMSMSFGREIRLPFLDYRLVSMALSLPTDRKLRDGWTKWILRRAMEGQLPPSIVWRKDKQGFVNPQAVWLQHQLRPQIEAMLTEPLLTARLGLIDQMALRRRYQAFCRTPVGHGPIGYQDIFRPLALEVWARQLAPHLADG